VTDWPFVLRHFFGIRHSSLSLSPWFTRTQEHHANGSHQHQDADNLEGKIVTGEK
jgi:hypothetical protein